MKNYMNALKSFEVSRLEYVQSLNNINITLNSEICDKLCMLFKSKMVILEAIQD